MSRVVPQHTTQKPYSVKALPNNSVTLPGQIETLSSGYRVAKPFTHLIIDGLFSIESLEQLVIDTVLMSNHNWMRHHEHRLEELHSRSAAELGEVGFQLNALLHSATFQCFLSELTGRWNLLPDPHQKEAVTTSWGAC